MQSLVGIPPNQCLPHGPSKLLVDAFIWHSPNDGVVASYSPKESDVKDHFGVFRGVDQIESFAQATVVACGAFLECKKTNKSFEDLFQIYRSAFLEVGMVRFHNFLKAGDTYVCIGIIKFFKFRQMVVDGRIYKVNNNINLNTFFKDFTTQNLLNFELTNDFELVSELKGVIGKAIKQDKLN